MNFFNAFPKILYSFDFKNQSPTLITNILARFKVRSEVLNNAYAQYKYQIQDGDTPEIVAYQQYGDARLYWIICLVNELEDPVFDFPLQQSSLEQKIIKKYGYNNITESYADIHHYELVVDKTFAYVDGVVSSNTSKHIVTLNQYNYTTESLELKSLGSVTVSKDIRSNVSNESSSVIGTATITSTYRPVYVYDYENEINEQKRQIKLLKSEYVQPIAKELENILIS